MMVQGAAGREQPLARSARALLTALMALAGVAFLYWIASGAGQSATMHAAQSTWALATISIAGGVLLTVGFAASMIRPYEVMATVITGLGLSWLASEVAGSPEAPTWAGSLAQPLGAMFMPLLVHLGLGYSRDPTHVDRLIIRLAYGVGGSFAMLMAFGHDPFLDLECWRSCSANVFAVFSSRELTRMLVVTAPWLVLIMGATFSVRLLSLRSEDGSRSHVVSWALLGLAVIAMGHSVLMITGIDPMGQPYSVLWALSGWLLAALAIGVGWDLASSVRRRLSLAALASELEEGTSGSLESILRRSLHDDTVDVEYWIPRLGRYVDPAGLTVDTDPGSGRSVATIERSGEELGRVLHGSALPATQLEREIGSAARLAVDNERLHAELRAQAFEMRASQGRIVLSADTARRRLERDLHDGAQQRLLTLSYQLRLAQGGAGEAGDETTAADLGLAMDELSATIDDVREVAHGIFPSVLADAGLARALESVREDSVIPQHIDVPTTRFAPVAEMAAYLLVTTTVETLEGGGMGEMSLVAAERDGHLDVDIEVSRSRLRPQDMIHAMDRVGALGGSVVFTPNGIHAEIPCG
jgi:signal transduction histidine kinase